jgi:hypothetical protein
MKRSTSVLTAERSRARGQITEARQNRQTKAPLVVEALKVLPVDLAGPLGDLADLLVGLVVLPVDLADLLAGLVGRLGGLADLLVGLVVLPVDLVGPLGDLADLLVGPEVHLAK